MSSIVVQPVSKIECSICSKSFLRTEHLTRHFRTHTDEKPYFCDVCSKGFSRSDILARHKNAHQLDNVQRTSNQNSKAIFRACYGCATARVKCSGSTPCQRCMNKRHECSYPVVQKKKKLKTKKRSHSKESFRTDEENRSPVVETLGNFIGVIDLNTSPWIVESFAATHLELGTDQVQSCQPRQGSVACESQQRIETSFDNGYSLDSITYQPSQNGKLQSWMQDSAQQSSPESYNQGFETLNTSVPPDLPLPVSLVFASGRLEQGQSSMYWLSSSESSDVHFSYGNQQHDNGIMNDKTSLSLDWEAVLDTEDSSIHQQHKIYRIHHSDPAVEASSPVSLRSSMVHSLLPGRYHSPASSISDCGVAVHHSKGKDLQQRQFQADWETHLRSQVSPRLKCHSPTALHSPTVSIDHSFTSHSLIDSKQFIHHRRHFSSTSSNLISPGFPNPGQSSNNKNRQYHIPITIEKQVLEHPSSRTFQNVIPTPLYTILMAQFKQNCLKHQQPFMSDYFPSVAVLELSVALYTEHFERDFPLLAKDDFRSRESSLDEEGKEDSDEALLLLAICAIGIAYLATEEAWLCSEAFLEFLQRMLKQTGRSSPFLSTEPTNAMLFRNSRADMNHLQARTLSVVAMFRSPNQFLVEQAFEGRKSLVGVLRSGVLSERDRECGGDCMAEAKKRAACCIWWLDCMMAQQLDNSSNLR